MYKYSQDYLACLLPSSIILQSSSLGPFKELSKQPRHLFFLFHLPLCLPIGNTECNKCRSEITMTSSFPLTDPRNKFNFPLPSLLLLLLPPLLSGLFPGSTWVWSLWDLEVQQVFSGEKGSETVNDLYSLRLLLILIFSDGREGVRWENRCAP